MKVLCTILLLTGISLMTGCNSATKRPALMERIIDDQAPNHLRMKTTGDINDDGKTDMLFGGWQSGGLVAYLAPGWKKQIINDSVKISTKGEVCDVNSDNSPDIVAQSTTVHCNSLRAISIYSYQKELQRLAKHIGRETHPTPR